jgi:hypothetical protein
VPSAVLLFVPVTRRRPGARGQVTLLINSLFPDVMFPHLIPTEGGHLKPRGLQVGMEGKRAEEKKVEEGLFKA